VPTMDLAAVVLDQKAPFVASPIISHLAACAGIASELPDEELDPDALSLAKVYLSGPRSFHGCSDVGVASKLNMGNSRVPRLVYRLGSAITLLDRADQASVEKAWSLVSGCELLEYIDGNRYDETPLGMRVREELLRESGNSRVDDCIESQLLPDQRQQLSLVGARVPQAAGSSGTKLKVMQTESSYTLLVKLMRDGSSSYLMVRGGSATWLHAADRMNADVIKHLLAATSACSRGALQFAHRTRAVTTDKFPANFRAEESILADRGATWKLLHFECRLHMNATIHTTTFNATEKDSISQMIHLVLSLRMGGQWAKFKALLRRWIRDHVIFLHGEPPLAAVKWKANAVRVFFGGGRSVVPKLALLRMFANGDWRNHEGIEYYYSLADPDDDHFKEAKRKEIADAIEEAIASAMPFLYPRHRWDGAEKSIEDLARLQCVHGLLGTIYHEYAKSFATSKARTARGAGCPDQHPRPDPREPADGHDDGCQDDLGDDEPVGEPPGAMAEGPSSSQNDEVDWQRENELHRRLGLKFISQKPFPFLVIMRLCMEPLRAHRMALRQMGGEEWEKKQMYAEAKAAASPEGLGGRPARTFRVLVCAQLLLERNYFHKLGQLYDKADLFSLMPTSSLFEEVSAKIFRTISRQGALMEYLFAHPSRGFPCRLFLLLGDRSRADELAAAPACLRGGFAEAFMAENDLRSDDAWFRLVALAHHCHMDMGKIESLHATIRRSLYQRHVQTTVPSLERMSAEFCAHTHRRRCNTVLLGVPRPEPPRSPDESDQNPLPKTHKPGAYRAFVASKAARDERGRLRANAGDDYRGLAGDDVSTLQEMSRAAGESIETGQILHGQGTFGPHRRVIEKVARSRAQGSRMVQAGAILEDDYNTEAILDNVFKGAPRSTSILSECRSQLRAVSTLMRSKTQMEDDVILKFVESTKVPELPCTRGPDAAAAVASMLKSLTPMPSTVLACFEARGTSTLDATRLVASCCHKAVGHTQARVAEVGRCLDSHWRSKHAMVYHDQVKKIGPMPAQPRRCWRAGVCLCSARGKRVLRLRNALHRQFREVYPRGSPLRTSHLVEGKVFCYFEGWSIQAKQGDPSETSLILQIAYQRLNPLEPVYQRMVLVEVVDDTTGELLLQVPQRVNRESI